MTANDNKPQRNVDASAPALEQQDWSDLAGASRPVSAPQNGDLRYARSEGLQPGELPEEDDDNPYQESDEALPDDAEERALQDDPGMEKDRFGEV